MEISFLHLRSFTTSAIIPLQNTGKSSFLRKKSLNIPYWCYGDDGPFFVGVSEKNSDSNKMRLELEEPMSGVLVYLNLSL